jgi:hypothetical protein
MSHAIIDAVSKYNIYRDFSHAYGGKLDVTPSLLYSGYISYLQSRNPESSIEYWKQYLGGIFPCNFPALTDGIEIERAFKSVKIEIGSAMEFIDFSQKNDLTLVNLLQVAWGLVLRCYSGADDVCFGYVASGRDVPLKGIDNAVGTYINMLVCRLAMAGPNPVIHLLRTVQDDFLSSLPHQHCSLAKIQNCLGLSGKTLFNTVMSFQRVPVKAVGERDMISFEVIAEQDPTEVRPSNL